jgi:hypothetical protein
MSRGGNRRTQESVSALRSARSRIELSYFRPSASARAVRQPHRRFGGFTASTSSEGLCGRIPSRRSRFALLRIAQRGRCIRLTISDTESFGHRVASSRSSSSVQRDIAASVMEAPSATYRERRFESRLSQLQLFHMEPFAAGVRHAEKQTQQDRVVLIGASST